MKHHQLKYSLFFCCFQGYRTSLLINDQFERLDGLLEYSDIPVWKWHGDVSQNKKQKLLKRPCGVMQTTPESLEALIMKKSAAVITLFSDLRYIIIDEVHYFMDSPL
ncbi:MAG: DEAD/DEAH box helicase [Acutalibacteraceae bacterium]|nr:DEAD/DEAH box helicase [Acutalibacteraceae bacterium]